LKKKIKKKKKKKKKKQLVAGNLINKHLEARNHCPELEQNVPGSSSL
jgi:hypothetical protein